VSRFGSADDACDLKFSPRAKRNVRAPTAARFCSGERLQRPSFFLILLSFLLAGEDPDGCLVEEIPAEVFGGWRHAVHVVWLACDDNRHSAFSHNTYCSSPAPRFGLVAPWHSPRLVVGEPVTSAPRTVDAWSRALLGSIVGAGFISTDKIVADFPTEMAIT
jgi:hypothetical protein